MTTRGFLLGKFMPPHRGHLFLCETALGMVDQLTILVCSLESEPIPGAKRFAWMRALAPATRVLHLERDMPQTPEDHPNFWEIWREAVREFHPEQINRLFGSEPYIFRLSKELGAAPVLVDPDREVFPVSGAAIREDPAAHWEFIPPAVRSYFQKRLCILGPESAGKSALTQILAAHFRTLAMPEYGRAFDVHYKQGKDWRPEDLIILAETHVAMRSALAPYAGPLLIEDTDPIQTAIWADFLVDKAPSELEALAASAPADHYLVLSPDIGWVDDGVRYAGGAETRKWFFDEAARRLRALCLSYDVIVGGDWNERTATAISVVEARFSGLLKRAL